MTGRGLRGRCLGWCGICRGSLQGRSLIRRDIWRCIDSGTVAGVFGGGDGFEGNVGLVGVRYSLTAAFNKREQQIPFGNGKPIDSIGSIGTTEVVPCYKTLSRPVTKLF